jgi:hypothetical protein
MSNPSVNLRRFEAGMSGRLPAMRRTSRSKTDWEMVMMILAGVTSVALLAVAAYLS